MLIRKKLYKYICAAILNLNFPTVFSALYGHFRLHCKPNLIITAKNKHNNSKVSMKHGYYGCIVRN